MIDIKCKLLFILLACSLMLLTPYAYAQEGFLTIEEMFGRVEQKQLPQNTAEAVFIAATNDMVISTSNPSVDNVRLPYKNSNNEYEYKLTLDLSEGHNGRYFTVEKKGTGFRAKTKQKIIFKTGECRYFKVVEPETKFVLNQIEESTHLVQGEACVEFFSPIPDLNVEAHKSLKYSIEVLKNPGGSYVTSLKISTLYLDDLRERYKNRPEVLEDLMTLTISFTNSNLETINLSSLTARKKLKYNIIPWDISSTKEDNASTSTLQYVVFEGVPENAMVSINNENLSVQNGIASKLMPPGTYAYQVNCSSYNSQKGSITVSSKKEIIKVILEPISRGIDISGQPCPNEPRIKDYDGNFYNTILIGHQCWMKENLRVRHYNDGTKIEMTNIHCPDNSYSNVIEYGYLYHWWAVAGNSKHNSSKPKDICPIGWHVPSNDEWFQLTEYVSNQSKYVCGKNRAKIAKALSSTTDWETSKHKYAIGNILFNNNASGFSARPAGYYNKNEIVYGYSTSSYTYNQPYYNKVSSYTNSGGRPSYSSSGTSYSDFYNEEYKDEYFYGFGYYAYFWSSTDDYYGAASAIHLSYNKAQVQIEDYNKNVGFSVRCIKD